MGPSPTPAATTAQARAPLPAAPGARSRPVTERALLATLARDAALGVPGVAAMDAGPLGTHVTVADDGGRLDGVICAASAEGYEVVLRLRCEPVALHPLGAQVQRAVTRAAAAAGLADALADVSVYIADVVYGPDR